MAAMHHITDPSFGDLLRRYRQEAGFSQEELAERARLSVRSISDLERGIHRAPYKATVAQLADALSLQTVQRAALYEAGRAGRGASSRQPVHVPAHDQPEQRPRGEALLTTKLSIPPARPGLVPRPRLTARLQAGLRGALTLLSAPPGCGKTTLLSAWRATPEGAVMPLGWVSLDADDNDPSRFWSYALAALDRARPGVAAAALALLHTPSPQGTPPPIESVLTALLNGLSASHDDLALALDDYHLVENPAIHHGITFLLDHLPPHLHLLIAARTDPPLPLGRLRARGDVTELRADELRCTGDEATAFLTETMGLPLSAQDIAALETRTEGWMAGLQLAALSLQGRPADTTASFIAAFAGSHRFVVDYLADEVLLRQPPEAQAFLLHTCILDRLCASLCAAIVENSEPQSHVLLERLERGNVFVVALDDERRWYRYHHLFGEVLRQQLARSGWDVAPLHRRACDWFERHGFMEEAIAHAIAAQAYERAADLIERMALPALLVGSEQTVSRWLDALPEALVRSRARLGIVRAWLVLDYHTGEQVERYLRDAEAALHDEAPPQTRGEIAATYALAAALRGDMAGVIARADEALDALDRDNLMMRSIVTMVLGAAYLGRGDLAGAGRVFEDVVSAARAAEDTPLLLGVTEDLSYLQRAQGSQRLAVETCRQALASLGHRDGQPLVSGAGVYLSLADLLREWNDLGAAARFAAEATALAMPVNRVGFQLFGQLVGIRIMAARGDLDGALDAVRRSLDLAREQRATWGEALLASCEAQLWLRRGDVEAATQALCRAKEAPPAPGMDLSVQYRVYSYEHCAIAPIQVAIARGRVYDQEQPLQAALGLAEQSIQSAATSGMAWPRIKALALCALAHDALGDDAAARTSLSQALALAETEGYIRLFLDEGAPMAALLHRIASQDAAPDYLHRLLGAFPTT